MDRSDARRILELMRVPDSMAFVVGVTDRRITIHDQQVRSLNLIDALAELEFLRAKTRICVVGAGIAGLTAAAGAAVLGAHVSVLEEATGLISMQAGSNTRFVHPHILRWPEDGWARARAELPVLGWSAGRAGEVARSIRDAFLAMAATRSVAIHLGVADVSIQAAPSSTGAVRLSWNGPGYAQGEFDLAVLAVGFGREREDVRTPSYWHDDDLHQEPLVDTLVSGCGDGGLTDVLRLVIADFSHGELVELLQSDEVDALRPYVAEIENDPNRSDVQLCGAYLDIETPGLEASLRARARAGGGVTLNGPADFPLDRRASPVNRFVVSRLMRCGLVGYRGGRLQEFHEGAGGVTVILDHGQELNVERLVVRHGPKSRPLDRFPGIAPGLTSSIANRIPWTTDVTRVPAWSTGRFPPPDPEVLGQPTVPDSTVNAAEPSWVILTVEGITESEGTADSVRSFFDGRDPRWSDIASGYVPARLKVGQIVDDLRDRFRSDGVGLSLMLGPAGEGKSTILRQVVGVILSMDLPIRVLWRGRSTDTVPLDELRNTPPDVPMLIVSDDAHEVWAAVDNFLRDERTHELAITRSAPIHLLLCSTAHDWQRAGGTKAHWRTVGVRVHTEWQIAGLGRDDAEEIVSALERVAEATSVDSVLGELRAVATHESRVEFLLDAAHGRVEAGMAGALLGALLVTRTGLATEAHVERMLDNLSLRSAPDRPRLLDSYLRAGFLHMFGAGAAPSAVLANALDVADQSLHELVDVPLADELVVRGVGSARSYQLRHDAIAAAVRHVALERPHLAAALVSAGRDIVASVVALFPEGWSTPDWRDVFYLSRRQDVPSEIRVAAAEGAMAGAPSNPFLAVTLASVYREVLGGEDGAARGSEVLLRFLRELLREGRPLASRALLTELAVCMGERGSNAADAASNAAVALLSVSDGIEISIDARDLHRGFGAIGRATLDLAARGRREVVSQALAGVAFLAALIDHRYAAAYTEAADGESLGEMNIASSLAALSDLLWSTWPEIPDEERKLLTGVASRFGLKALAETLAAI